MTIRVLFFASLTQALGESEMMLALPDGSTVGDAMAVLLERYAPLGALRDRVAVAVNLEYVGAEHQLKDGDELALIPPVSGG